MSENATENGKKGKPPSHVVYIVRDGKKQDESYWDRCGVAWAHDDGKGLNVQIHAVPLDGRLVIR